MATHPDIKDKDLRVILANELNIIRGLFNIGIYDDDALFWMKVGLLTGIRRVQYTRDNPC